MLHPQITACKQQAPDSSLFVSQLAEYDLLVNLRAEYFSGKEILHHHFCIRASLTDQLSDQAVAAGVGPIWRKFPFIQVIDD